MDCLLKCGSRVCVGNPWIVHISMLCADGLPAEAWIQGLWAIPGLAAKSVDLGFVYTIHGLSKSIIGSHRNSIQQNSMIHADLSNPREKILIFLIFGVTTQAFFKVHQSFDEKKNKKSGLMKTRAAASSPLPLFLTRCQSRHLHIMQLYCWDHSICLKMAAHERYPYMVAYDKAEPLLGGYVRSYGWENTMETSCSSSKCSHSSHLLLGSSKRTPTGDLRYPTNSTVILLHPDTRHFLAKHCKCTPSPSPLKTEAPSLYWHRVTLPSIYLPQTC